MSVLPKAWMPQQSWLTSGSNWSSRRMLWFQRNLISWWRKSGLRMLTPALNLSVLYTVQSFLHSLIQVFQDTLSPPPLLLATFILNVWCLLRWIWADKGIFKVPGACCRFSIFLHTITLPFSIPHPDSHHGMLMWYRSHFCYPDLASWNWRTSRACWSWSYVAIWT